MSGQKFDLIEIVLGGGTFDYNDEYSKIKKINQDALKAMAVVQEVDASKFIKPEEFANHFNELQKVSSLTSDVDNQLCRLNDVYLAELRGRHEALSDLLEIAILSDKSAKNSMFSVQMLIVALFFGFVSVGYIYGLTEGNYRYIMGVMGFLVFMAFTRRKLIPMAPVIQTQIDSLDVAMKDFAETALKNRKSRV